MEVVARASWTHADQDAATPAEVLDIGRIPAETLFLTVDEGDNAPLPITGVRLLLPSYRLRFYRPAGSAGSSLRLVYGRADLPPPQYDITLLARHVMGSDAEEVALDAAPAPTSRDAFMSRPMFLGLLGAAVLVLLAIIARLVATADRDTPPAAGGS
jgi:hypothetical protein